MNRSQMRKLPARLFAVAIAAALLVSAPNPATAALGDCGQPVSLGTSPVAGDCLYILKNAIGAQTCDPCVCDVSGADGATSSDALLCLRFAVGQAVTLACQPCSPPPPGEGEVMNEACVVCHGPNRIVDIAEVHPGLQTLADVDASIDSVSVAVDDIALTATLTVNFTVTDADGNYIPALGDPNASRPDRFAYLRFAVAELQPALAGTNDPDLWQDYTTGDRNPANLTDNGDGTYAYVFGTNLYDMYDATLRHRLLMMVYGNIVEQAKNVTYDFVPDQLPGPFTFDTSRDIVTTTACNQCHERLGSPLGDASFHGGSRYLTEACATCHTTNRGDPGIYGDGVAYFPWMVHKIHAAQNIEGLQDFSDVTYPQDLRNCAKCHAGTDGANWNMRPSRTACGSCHEDVDFNTNAGATLHLGGIQTDNSMCVLCHQPNAIIGYHTTENATPNNPDVPAGLVNLEYVIDEVTVNANNEAVVTFHINVDGAPMDLTTIPPAGFSGGPSFLVAYALPQDGLVESIDYNQLGRSAGQPASVSLSSLEGTLTGTPDSYTAVLTAAPFPDGATMRAVALQGYFTQVVDATTSVARHTPSVVKAVTGDRERRQLVDSAKCLNCHEILELHGGNRVNNVQVCVICHNPNLSSSGRTADTSLTAQAQKDALAAAGYDPEDSLTWPEATMQLKNLVHGIHGAGERDYVFDFVRNRQNGIYYDFSEVTFPGILSNCETCHLPGTYDADLPEGLLVTTDITTDGINATQADVSAARASVPNPTDLINSPTAGTCYMCHDSNPAVAHFGQNGGVIDNWRAEALGE